jgi:hypothetical protein
MSALRPQRLVEWQFPYVGFCTANRTLRAKFNGHSGQIPTVLIAQKPYSGAANEN